MSMPKFPPVGDLTRDDAINQIISSIAMEELGLAHILNAEGEKMQFVLGTLEGGGLDEPPTIDEVLDVNKSVTNLLETATRSQMFLQTKLDKALAATTMQGPKGDEGPVGPPGPAGALTTSYFSGMTSLSDPERHVEVGQPIPVNVEVAHLGGDIENNYGMFTLTTGAYLVNWSFSVQNMADVHGIHLLSNGIVVAGSLVGNNNAVSGGSAVVVVTGSATVKLTPYGTSTMMLAQQTPQGTVTIVKIAD